MQAKTSRTLINKKKLLAMIPLCERTIYNLEQRGEFPRRIALTSRNVAWDLADVEQWIETRKSSGIQAAHPGMGPNRGNAQKRTDCARPYATEVGPLV
ncbi:AlpA family phage regulatory protein [Burkholderia multivorans]|uniref:helix-turn-helix transcriptional regulator n=1 Tax=Burkholderia multivorans TaxID=87883 RepID=UPI000D0067B1|nr:AlpA family phage regulatory protein [Burkholderia multivorans]MDN8003142.1 AlpA family phage regulatory protein [Burkholderia multivorans]PRH00197.1 transcriptional regulator [Burkholderia multivorans]